MLSTFATLPSGGSLSDARLPLRTAYERSQKVLPVLNAEGILQGIVTRRALAQRQDEVERNVPLAEILHPVKAQAYPDETLQAVVDRMADKEVTSMPVVDRQSEKVLGVISLDDLLKARAHHLEEERDRRQVLRWRLFSSPRTRVRCFDAATRGKHPPNKKCRRVEQ
jgi:CBS-domain-containing membrane protein